MLPDADEREQFGAEIAVVHRTDDVDDVPITQTRLPEAVMLGAPYEGGEPAFITPGADGNPVVTHTIGPVRMSQPVTT